MNKIGKKAASLIVWASAYVDVIVFALCGGYVWLKSNDETVKKETKKALIVTLLFVAVGMMQTFVGQCLSLFGVSYGSDLYTAHQIITNVITIAKIVVYAVFALLAFFKNENAAVNGAGSVATAGDNAAQTAQTAQKEAAASEDTPDAENK
ncbi:MAG: hypothetical protein ACI4RO_02225 [Candidatus Scatosoma sp.]